MENETLINETIEKEMIISSEMKRNLQTTSKWANFLAILGFIFVGLIVFTSLLLLILSPFIGSWPFFGSKFGIPFVFFGIIYVVMAALYFFPALYLYNFASKAKKAVDSNNQTIIDDSFLNLKKLFRFLGIMTIVIMSLYLLMIPIMVIVSMSKLSCI
jgi:hypothetical protein